MVGLAVMGRNLALNIADHGFRVAVWNLEAPVTDKFVAEYGDGQVRRRPSRWPSWWRCWSGPGGCG